MERNVVFNGGVDVEEVVELLPHTHHSLGLHLNNRGINAQCTLHHFIRTTILARCRRVNALGQCFTLTAAGFCLEVGGVPVTSTHITITSSLYHLKTKK